MFWVGDYCSRCEHLLVFRWDQRGLLVLGVPNLLVGNIEYTYNTLTTEVVFIGRSFTPTLETRCSSTQLALHFIQFLETDLNRPCFYNLGQCVTQLEEHSGSWRESSICFSGDNSSDVLEGSKDQRKSVGRRGFCQRQRKSDRTFLASGYIYWSGWKNFGCPYEALSFPLFMKRWILPIYV